MIEILCSWCGEHPAIGEDQFNAAPTCGECGKLVVVRPFGWAEAMRRAGRRGVIEEVSTRGPRADVPVSDASGATVSIVRSTLV